MNMSLALSSGFELLRPRSVSRARIDLTRQSLDRLLTWLHPDRDEAGRLYEHIRRGLIKVFTSRGCDNSGEMADETIDRVIGKVEQIAGSFQGDPALYFYGVARNVHREYRKVKRVPVLVPPPEAREESGAELDCLDECLGKLLPKNRELLVEYYQEDKQAKIDHRKALAGRHGLEMNALRIRVHRVRSVVRDCTAACLQRSNIR